MPEPVVRIYLRVSTQEQAHIGMTMRDQLEQCKRAASIAYPAMEQLVYDEVESAYKVMLHRRPAGRRLVADLRTGDQVYCAKTDRMFRSMADAIAVVSAWQTRNIGVHMLDFPLPDSPLISRLMLAILAWCAEFESSRKGERLLDSFRQRRRLGYNIARCCRWGLRKHRDTDKGPLILVPDQESLEIMAMVWRWAYDEGVSECDIRLRLQDSRIAIPKAQREAQREGWMNGIYMWSVKHVFAAIRGYSLIVYLQRLHGINQTQAVDLFLALLRNEQLPNQRTVAQALGIKLTWAFQSVEDKREQRKAWLARRAARMDSE